MGKILLRFMLGGFYGFCTWFVIHLRRQNKKEEREVEELRKKLDEDEKNLENLFYRCGLKKRPEEGA